jgi:hypothetical protein
VRRYEAGRRADERRHGGRARRGRPGLPGAAPRRRHGRDRRARLQRPAGRVHGRAREHARGSQRRRVHAVLLLSVARARAAARWYKSPAYRSRIVREPRAVLAELGLELPPRSRSASGTRAPRCAYLVLPERPAAPRPLGGRAARLRHARRDDRRGLARAPGEARLGHVEPSNASGGAAAAQRRARLRGALGEPTLRRDARALPAGRFEWEEFRRS